MTHEHVCRIVRDVETASERGWALYWDGAYCDNYASTQQARAAALVLSTPARGANRVTVSVEDASGRRVSTERLTRAAA